MTPELATTLTAVAALLLLLGVVAPWLFKLLIVRESRAPGPRPAPPPPAPPANPSQRTGFIPADPPTPPRYNLNAWDSQWSEEEFRKAMKPDGAVLHGGLKFKTLPAPLPPPTTTCEYCAGSAPFASGRCENCGAPRPVEKKSEPPPALTIINNLDGRKLAEPIETPGPGTDSAK